MKLFSQQRLFFVLVGLFIAEGAAYSESVNIDGSSTVYPISEAVAEEYRYENSKVRVPIGVSGTGGGFKKLCMKEVDLVGASREIKPFETQKCRDAGIDLIAIPVAYDAITIVVNPSNTWVEEVTVGQLKEMWEPDAQGKVESWVDIDPRWPKEELHLYGPGVDSGTFDYFTEAVVGKSAASRGDFTSSEDDNVIVRAVKSDKFALGFFGLAYYEENKRSLKALRVKKTAESPGVAPSYKSVKDGSYAPLSRKLFLYVRKDAMKRQAVKEFLQFYLRNASELAKEVGYVALSENEYKDAEALLSKDL